MQHKLLESYQNMQFDGIRMDSKKTGERLKQIRTENENLIKYVCRHSRFFKYINRSKKIGGEKDSCGNRYDCLNCSVAQSYEEEASYLGKKAYCNASLESLGRCFERTGKELSNMEASGTGVTLEKIMTYAYIAKIPLSQIIVFEDDEFYFDNDGIIRRKGDPEYTPIDDSNE